MDNANFRSSPPHEGRVFGGPSASIISPPLPPRIQNAVQSPYGAGPMASMGSMGSNYYGYGGGGYGVYGGGGFNSYNSGMYGGGGGMFGNRFGMGGGGYGGYGGGPGVMGGSDLESRFIQMAEENSRPAFQSIESFVSVIGNFATMLDSTFFALSNSFRAILGVTANLGKLRTMFGQFLSSIALFRGLSWLWRKVLYTLHLSKTDASSTLFKEAFNVAAANSANGIDAVASTSRVSAWPMIAFLSFIFAGPYLIMKMVGKGASPNNGSEAARNPQNWSQSIPSQVMYTFQAAGPQELSVAAGDVVYVAPKDIQNSLRLMNTGWAIATKDFHRSGMVPINYLQRTGQNSGGSGVGHAPAPLPVQSIHPTDSVSANPSLGLVGDI